MNAATTGEVTLSAGRDYSGAHGRYEYVIMECTNGAADEWRTLLRAGSYKSKAAALTGARRAWADYQKALTS